MPKPPIQLKRSGTASATPSSLEHGELALNYADSKVFFKNASNTISSFTFQSYALASHTHAASDITSGTLDAARLPLATTIAAGAVIVGTGLGVSSGTVSVTYGTTNGTACQGNDSRLSDARTPTSHSHGNITNAGAIGSSANLPIITTTSGVLTTGSFGTSAATFCEGNDSRLSDTRTPTDGSVTTAKIANDAVTYAKIQNVSATDRLLGRSSAGAGDVEEVTCTAAGRALLSGADAAAQRATLSVQPTASPAFTGAATFDNTGNVVPLTVTNTGTANSFVVNDASGDTSPFVITSAGDVTIGTGRTVTGGSGGAFLASNGLNNDLVTTGRAAAITGTWGTLRVHQVSNYAGLRIIGDTSQTASYMDVENSSGTTLVSINSSGQLLVTAGSASAPGVAFSGDTNTGIAQLSAAGADTISLVTAGSERLRISSTGAVGISTDPVSGFPLAVFSFATSDANKATLLLNGTVGSGQSFAGIRFTHNVFSTGWAADILCVDTGNFGGILSFRTSAAGSATATPTERVRIDASGNVGVGASSPSSLTPRLHISSAYSAATASTPYNGVFIASSDAQAANTGGVLSLGGLYDASSGPTRFAAIAGLKDNATSGEFGGYMAFYTRANGSAPAERLRINSAGEVLIGTTTDNGAYLLQVNSQIYATNATIATSDARFKANVQSLTDATAVIAAMRPVAFDFIPHAERNFATERQVGLIAQEAQSALAGVDYADSVVAQCGDHLGLAYEKLVPVLIRALQESNARIAALEERVNHA